MTRTRQVPEGWPFPRGTVEAIPFTTVASPTSVLLFGANDLRVAVTITLSLGGTGQWLPFEFDPGLDGGIGFATSTTLLFKDLGAAIQGEIWVGDSGIGGSLICGMEFLNIPDYTPEFQKLPERPHAARGAEALRLLRKRLKEAVKRQRKARPNVPARHPNRHEKPSVSRAGDG